MIDLYGIPNCDTVKRARAWLDAHDIPHRFHDFKREGVTDSALERWIQVLGWEALVNRRGTTWRQLDAAERERVVDAPGAKAVLQAHTSLVKRPVVEWTPSTVTVGFDAGAWASHHEKSR